MMMMIIIIIIMGQWTDASERIDQYSYIEVYNDAVFDLLARDPGKPVAVQIADDGTVKGVRSAPLESYQVSKQYALFHQTKQTTTQPRPT